MAAAAATAAGPLSPPAPQLCAAEERSGHCAVVDGNCLYVWGGYVTNSAHHLNLEFSGARLSVRNEDGNNSQGWKVIVPVLHMKQFWNTVQPEPIPAYSESIEENEVYLPNDEVWIYDIDSGLWSMHLMKGDLPPSMSGSCGACIDGKLYLFGGFDDKGYSNRLYYVNLRTRNGTYLWKKITDFNGQPPTPRDKLACWVYKDRLIYFGGYGCRKQNELSDCFDVHDAFWEGQIYWGWHNDVHVFDTSLQTWYQPKIKRGDPPQPRAAHSCAVLGNKGYVFGGRVLQTRMNDLHSLNLDTWAWSGKICTNGEKPGERSWHTLTPIADDKLFLFGGLSSDNVPLSDGWIYSVAPNEWQQLAYLPKSRPRLWHTACLGKEGEVMVFGGSKDDLHFLDTGHCSDLLIFQTQPYSLHRLCLDCIAKNAVLLENQISWLPSKLLEQAMDKITYWAAVSHRREKKAETEGQEQSNFT